MRFYDKGSSYGVSISPIELSQFKRRWPGSRLPTSRSIFFEFEKRNGDLVDIQGTRYDGEEMSALAEDAKKFGQSKLGIRSDNPRRRPIPTPANSRTRRIARATVDELDRNATYRVRGYPGIAFYTRGYVVEKKPILFDDGEWTGDYDEVEDRSRAVMVMVGDDRKHIVDIDDLTVLPEGEYCHSCGQIGCGHDTES